MEGIKEKEEKLIYDIDFGYVKGMAERMQLNRGKYLVGNWQKEIQVEDLKQAMFRHIIEIMMNNYHDEQSYGHLFAVGCNAFMILEQLKKEKDEEIIKNKREGNYTTTTTSTPTRL
jgi:hypothetical protein